MNSLLTLAIAAALTGPTMLTGPAEAPRAVVQLAQAAPAVVPAPTPRPRAQTAPQTAPANIPAAQAAPPADAAPQAAPGQQATDAAPPVANETLPVAIGLEPLPGIAGPYLAARQAAVDSDFAAAAQYFSDAVANDPADPFLQDSALVSLVSAGEMDRAVTLADKLLADSRDSELATLVRRIDLARKGEWDAVLTSLDDRPSPSGGGGQLIDPMMRAWAQMGAGRASDAFATLEKLDRDGGAGGMARFQLALAKASVGDYDAAATALDDPDTSTHLMGIVARVQVLSQLERNADALAVLDKLDGIEDEPVLADLKARLTAGEQIPFTVVKTPQDGIAQVLVTFGGALTGGEDTEPLALIYARLAQYLAPDLADARLLTAQLLQSVGQFDMAEREFEALRLSDQMRPVAELARIDALSRAERPADAEAAARALTEAHPELAAAWIALGDLLRQQDKFADAVPAYDRALALLQTNDDPQASWFPLYARGIALERSGQFDRADADFQAALALQPDQAPILNYLGYSWVDRNVRLDEGLALIKKAVELRPDDGYILDSLAWAYYRLGRYQEAVAPMEKSVSAMSNDSLVNDHMGDIYWMVGRKREAEIQWHRAQSLYKPEDTDTDLNRIRAKLAVGLDAVLAAEKAHGGKLPEGFGQPEPAPQTGADAAGEDAEDNAPVPPQP